MTAFSQAGTIEDTCAIRLQCDVARKVALDLVRKDQLEEEVVVYHNTISTMQLKIQTLDRIVDAYEIKEENYLTQLDLVNSENEILRDRVEALNKKLKRNKVKLRIASAVGGAALTILTLLLTL